MNIEEEAKKLAGEEEITNNLPASVGEGDNLPTNAEPEEVIKQLQGEYFKNQIKDGKTLTDITADFAKATTTNEIINDKTKEGEAYRKGLKDKQRKALEESFNRDIETEKTKTINEKQKKAEAFYKSFRPILEFDFSNLINDNKEENKPKKTYEDRGYGIGLMCLMLLLLTVPYFAFSVVLAIFNGINAILKELATFGKISRILATSIFIIAIGVLVVYCGICGVEKLFNLEIIHKVLPMV